VRRGLITSAGPTLVYVVWDRRRPGRTSPRPPAVRGAPPSPAWPQRARRVLPGSGRLSHRGGSEAAESQGEEMPSRDAGRVAGTDFTWAIFRLGCAAIMNAPPPTSPPSAVRVKHPILWVPTSYFSMGTIYMTITLVTTIMYKNLGMADEDAAFWASALGFPYVIKFLWAPLLEMFGTKKIFVVTSQLGIAALFVAIAIALK